MRVLSTSKNAPASGSGTGGGCSTSAAAAAACPARAASFHGSRLDSRHMGLSLPGHVRGRRVAARAAASRRSAAWRVRSQH